MPDFIVTQTQQEYSAYQKKKEREATRNSCLAVIFALSALAGLCYWLQP